MKIVEISDFPRFKFVFGEMDDMDIDTVYIERYTLTMRFKAYPSTVWWRH